MSRSFKLAKKKAVSIMELSVVLAVLGLLVVGFSSYQALRKTAEVNSLVETSQNLAKAIITYSSIQGLIPGDVNKDRYITWGNAASSGANESLKTYQDLAFQNLISMPTRTDSEIGYNSGGVHAIVSGQSKNVVSTKISGVGITPVSFSNVLVSAKYYVFDNSSGNSITLVVGSRGVTGYGYTAMAGLTSPTQVSSNRMTDGESVPYSLVVAMDGKVDSETGAAQGDLKYNPTESANTAFGYIVRF